MKPIKFKGHNIVVGENNKEYLPLPAQLFPDGELITCWKFSNEEVENIIKSKCMYIRIYTFNNPMQPILPTVLLEDSMDLNLDI